MNIVIANKLNQAVDISLSNPGGGVDSVKLGPHERIPNTRRPQTIPESTITDYTRGLADKGYIRIRKG